VSAREEGGCTYSLAAARSTHLVEVLHEMLLGQDLDAPPWVVDIRKINHLHTELDNRVLVVVKYGGHCRAQAFEGAADSKAPAVCGHRRRTFTLGLQVNMRWYVGSSSLSYKYMRSTPINKWYMTNCSMYLRWRGREVRVRWGDGCGILCRIPAVQTQSAAPAAVVEAQSKQPPRPMHLSVGT
jgi:hypothetical protein